MADNVTLPGTGSSVAADEIGGVAYQRVKLAVGADGAASDLAPGQATMASSLPVAIASNQSAVPVSDSSGSLTVDGTVTVAGAAADDAAASGNPVPVGAVYQATPDTVDDGDVGRLRMTARRGLVVAPEYSWVLANSSSVANAGDMEVSTDGITWVAPTTAFFNGADAGFDGARRYVRVPMNKAGYTVAAFSIYHDLGVNVEIGVTPVFADTYNYFMQTYSVASQTIGHGGTYLGAPGEFTYPHGAGGNWQPIPNLAMPMVYLIIYFDPASDPSSGSITIGITRR